MKVSRTKSARVIGATLGCCLGLTGVGQSGLGQTPHRSVTMDNMGTLTAAQEAEAKAGKIPAGLTEEQARAVQLFYNIHELTPGQQTQAKQTEQMDNAARLALNVGRYDEAVTDAKRAIATDEGDVLAPKILAEALEAQGKTQEALAAYQSLAEWGSSKPEDLMPYALLLLQQGQWRKALAAYEKSLPFVPEGTLLRAYNDFSPDAPQPAALEAAIHVARGLVLNTGTNVTRQPQNDKALAEYERALALAPDSALAHFYHGYGLKKLGRKAEAKAAFDKAAQLGGDEVKAEVAKFSR